MTGRTFWVEGKCYIDKIKRHVFFKYPVCASTSKQARFFVCENLQTYFKTSEYLNPEFIQMKGMNSAMNHLRGTAFKIFEDKAMTIELDGEGKRLNDPPPRIKKTPRTRDELPF